MPTELELATDDRELLEGFTANLTEVRTLYQGTDARLAKIETDLRIVKQRSWRPPGAGDGAGASQSPPLVGNDGKFRDWLRGTRTQKAVFAGSYSGFRIEQKASPLLNTGGTTHVGTVNGPPQQSLRLIELIPSVPMTSGAAAEYAKETAFTPGANLVAEGALKPTTSIDFVNALASIKTVATITKASVQSLSDTPGLGDWLDQRLRYAVQLKAEDWLLNAPLPDGLLANAGALNAGFTPGTGATALDYLAAAIGQLQSAGFSPDGIVMSGVDVNGMRLLKTVGGEYLWSSPDSGLGVASAWGIPLVISPFLAAGSWLVGAFGQSTVIFARQQLVVEVAYENEDDFTKNLACLRAEERLGVAVPVPAGLVTGTFPATPPALAARESVPSKR